MRRTELPDNPLMLDTDIHLGFMHGTNEVFNNLMDYLLFKTSDWEILFCEGLRKQIERNLKRYQIGIHLYYRHVYHRFDQLNKIKFGEESSLPPKCNVSHKNDRIIVACAVGSKSKILISEDGRLELSPECGIQKMTAGEFLEAYQNGN